MENHLRMTTLFFVTSFYIWTSSAAPANPDPLAETPGTSELNSWWFYNYWIENSSNVTQETLNWSQEWIENSTNATQETFKSISRDARVYLEEAQNDIFDLTDSINERFNNVVEAVVVENYVIETVCRIAGVQSCEDCQTSSNSTLYINPVVCYVCCNGTTGGNPVPPPTQDDNSKRITQWFIETFNWLGLHTVYQFMASQRDDRANGASVRSVINNFNFKFLRNSSMNSGSEVSNKFRRVEVCGYYTDPKHGRVVGGSDVNSQGVFPWQLSLSTAMFGMFYQHRCGASLLSKRWVLTAAHCMQEIGLQNTVVMGGFLSQNEHDVAQIIRVEEVFVHPDFDTVLYEQDIALLSLAEPVIYSSLILPVCLPTPDMDYAGTTAVLTGWGREWDNGPLTEQLNKVDLPIITNEECMQWYRESKSPQSIPKKTFMCAGVKDGTKDACTGDSGGPLINYREDRRAELIGIVSWGIGCGTAGRPGVYTRVNTFIDWIHQTMTDNPPTEEETTLEGEEETTLEGEEETMLDREEGNTLDGEEETMMDGEEETMLDGEEETMLEEEQETRLNDEQETMLEGEEETTLDGEEETMLDGEEETTLDGEKETMLEGEEETTQEEEDTMLDIEKETILDGEETIHA